MNLIQMIKELIMDFLEVFFYFIVVKEFSDGIKILEVFLRI